MTIAGSRPSDHSLRAVHGVLVAPLTPATRRRGIGRTTTIAVVLAIVLGGAFVGYQRIGTVANADLVEYTQNLAGGFLAIGMTDDQPGFVIFSERDREEVVVESDLVVNWAAGNHTVVRITTSGDGSTLRLRRPVVVLVSGDGTLAAREVDLTFEEFVGMRQAADCSFEEAVARKRCGAPFADVGEYLATFDPVRIPAPVRSFLARHAPKPRR